MQALFARVHVLVEGASDRVCFIAFWTNSPATRRCRPAARSTSMAASGPKPRSSCRVRRSSGARPAPARPRARVSTFVLASDDPRTLEVYGHEVAPVLREAVRRRARLNGCVPGPAGGAAVLRLRRAAGARAAARRPPARGVNAPSGGEALRRRRRRSRVGPGGGCRRRRRRGGRMVPGGRVQCSSSIGVSSGPRRTMSNS